MADFVLKRSKVKTWTLDIDDQSFEIPLAPSLTPEKYAQLDTAEGTQAFFKEYIPKEIADTLTIDDFNAITNAWVSASGGLKKVGE